MKTIILFAISLSLLISTVAFGQNKRYYHKNTFDKVFSNCQYPPTFGTDSTALQNYLSEKLQNQISRTSGSINIGVLIDTSGKTMCEWIQNKSNNKMKEEKLNLLIDSMPNWNCGIQNGRKVNCVEIIEMTFNKEKLDVSYRMGNRIMAPKTNPITPQLK